MQASSKRIQRNTIYRRQQIVLFHEVSHFYLAKEIILPSGASTQGIPMPLPNKFQRCRATAKSTQIRCQNPAAFGCSTCRLHGARRPASIKRGKDHPLFKHGFSTLAAKEERQSEFRALRKLELMMDRIGLGTGPRLRGRKS